MAMSFPKIAAVGEIHPSPSDHLSALLPRGEEAATCFDEYSPRLLWESLDAALRAWCALRQLEFYIDLYRRDTCEDTRSEREPGATFGQSQIHATFQNLKLTNREVEIITMFSDPKTRGENDSQ
ncbi:hypothetical protein NP233_g8717 [Leucocoprinus birnbaumii]|uniref:Uncharacterized protein n=1 Tax=Leucocoprinus birnbaumii TaxID=56174 RepID=A0AAD5VNH9_9AGAR|nr:hypothetical protein NP233_g8717 [Leucocoprinus birnbaumii]